MSQARTTKGLIFDMDGCLLDTEAAYRIAWRQAFAKYAIAISKETIESWVGLSWDLVATQIDKITQSQELTLAIRESREEIFEEMLRANLVNLMPGAEEILLFAKNNNLIIGLASSTLGEKGKKLLVHFGLLAYFDFTVFGDEVEHRKPAGDIYQLAIKKSGLTPSELLVFEDTLVGCQAANKANLQTVWVPENFAESVLKDYPPTVCEIVTSMRHGKKFLEKNLAQ